MKKEGQGCFLFFQVTKVNLKFLMLYAVVVPERPRKCYTFFVISIIAPPKIRSIQCPNRWNFSFTLGRDNKITTEENQVSWINIIQSPYITKCSKGKSGESTTVKSATKYIGAFGFKALHRKPTATFFKEDFFMATSA